VFGSSPLANRGFFDLRELLIIQAKGDVLRPLGFTHLLVSNNEQSPQSGR
jgi:hypothetical protein